MEEVTNTLISDINKMSLMRTQFLYFISTVPLAVDFVLKMLHNSIYLWLHLWYTLRSIFYLSGQGVF